MMISGITQSLNSGFSQNLNVGLSPALTPGSTLSSSFTPAMTPALTPAMTPGLTPALTPAMTPALIPGLQPTLRVGGSMEPGILQHIKQIRKPMLKASIVDPSLSEEEVNMKFVQDLLNWVEEMQVRITSKAYFVNFFVLFLYICNKLCKWIHNLKCFLGTTRSRRMGI